MRPLVRELRYAADRVTELGALEHHVFVVVARKHRFIVRELSGENARDQQPMTYLEK